MYYEWFQKYRRTIAYSLLTITVLFIVWSITTAISHIGKIPVVVSVVPGDAKVTLNNAPFGGGTQWLAAGTYTVNVSKDGYASRQKTVIITSDKSQNVIALALTPQSDEAKKWAEVHDDQYTVNQDYGNIEAQTNGEYFTKRHPIVAKLPYEDPYFQIYYAENAADDSVSLTVTTASPRYRYYAVQKIRELGFNPTDYRINFKDFNNPLKKVSDA